MKTVALWLAAFVVVIIAAEMPAAAQSADTRYAVTYVEVMPSGRVAMTDAFARYRDAARNEPGFVSVELSEQVGRPGHYVILEAWQQQAAFDEHQKSASLAQFTSALQPIRTSGYDQRPYRPLAVGPSRVPVPAGAVQVVAHVDIGGGAKIDVAAVLGRLAAASRAERGCLRFDVLQHTVRMNHFTVVEVWESQAALDAHAAAAHTKQYRDEVQPVTGSPIDERVQQAVF